MFERILVALGQDDLAVPESTQVIDALCLFNLRPEHKVILAHVVSIGGGDHEIEADRPSFESHVDGVHQLEQRLEQIQSRLPCASTMEVVSGDPSEEIVRLANIHHADLILLGSRGLTGVHRILQNSVGSQVVNDSPCSVLVMKVKPS